MKKLILILFFECICLWSYTRSREAIVLKLAQGNIKVYLFGSSLMVDCRTLYYYDLFPKRRTIFDTSYYYYDGDTISPFQNLYDWIKEIEEVATSNHRYSYGQTINMKFHRSEGCCYNLRYHESYIVIQEMWVTDRRHLSIRTDKSNMGAKMKFKTIAEFKNRLLEYTLSHNISIKL